MTVWLKKDVLTSNKSKTKYNLISENLNDLFNRQDSSSTSIVLSIITNLPRRMKLIRIADKSHSGWTNVWEYESDDLVIRSEQWEIKHKQRSVRSAHSRKRDDINHRWTLLTLELLLLLTQTAEDILRRPVRVPFVPK